MPTLLIKGDVHPELQMLGIKPGDKIKAEPCLVSKVGVMHFTVYKGSYPKNCSIWPENYDIIDDNPSTKKSSNSEGISPG